MTYRNLLPKGVTRFFPLIFFGLLIVSFLSCNSDKKEGDKTSYANLSPSTNFQMNCVILERSQVQAWVDSGWTKPSYPAGIKTLSLQFYTSDASAANSNMQLIAYPGQSATDVKRTGEKILKIDTGCVAKILTGPVVFGNNAVNLADLKILKADGTLNDFDFIRFVPASNFPPYVNFSIEVVRSGVTELLTGILTDPCPPYCPPPPPPPPPPSEK
ncbi:MAG: hypothetical protein JJE22_20180 [Bacteroidia bacterium]|nr:hypothetical protein [Bacteroidia bacterium]